MDTLIATMTKMRACDEGVAFHHMEVAAVSE